MSVRRTFPAIFGPALSLVLCLLTVSWLPTSRPLDGMSLWVTPIGMSQERPESVLQAWRAGQLEVMQQAGLGRGLQQSDLWLVMRLDKPLQWGEAPRLVVGQALTDTVTLYHQQTPEHAIRLLGDSGLLQPPARRPSQDRLHTFKLGSPDQLEGLWLIHVRSRLPTAVHVAIESDLQYTQRLLNESVVVWVVIVGACVAYAAAWWAGRLLDSSSLRLSASVVGSYTFYAMTWNGVLTTALPWTNPLWADLIVFASGLLATWAICDVMLAVLPHAPAPAKLRQFIRCYRPLGLPLGLITWWAGYAPLLSVGAWLQPLLLLMPWSIWLGWRGGSALSRPFMLTFALQSVALILQELGENGVLTMSPLTGYAWQIVALYSVLSLFADVIARLIADRQHQWSEQARLQQALRQERQELRRRVQTRTQELELANEALRQAEQAHRRMLSMASHEFRTPAAMIKASLDALRFLPNDQTQGIQEPLARLDRASAELISLTNRVILLDQWHQLVHTPIWDTLDLREWLLEAAADHADEEALGLDLPDDDTALEVSADARLLRVALETALQQALARCSRQTSSVVMRLSREAQRARIEIRDDGPSLDVAQMNVLHQLLARAEMSTLDSRHLGWSVVAAVWHQHHGQAQAFSPPEGGLCVILHLPLQRSAKEARA